MNVGNIQDIYELSPMQQGMLFHTLYAPHTGIYVEEISYLIRGDFQADLFRHAWQEVTRRHAVLRTSLHWEGLDNPVQVVQKQVELPWYSYDWRDKTAEQQAQQLATLRQTEREKGFDLTQAPLMRFFIIQQANNVHQFIWQHHHTIMDAWSLSLVLKEVSTYYDAFCQGQTIQLPQPRSYQEYIAWLRKQDLTQAEAFWRQTFAGVTEPTILHIDQHPKQISHDNYHAQPHQFSITETAELRAFARQHQLTFNTLIQGAWALLLSHYSGRDDVIFGVTVSGRSPQLEGVDGMVGLFINTLPARVQTLAHTPLLPWLKQLQTQQIEIRQYEHTPLIQIQSWVGIQPLFDTFLVFGNQPGEQKVDNKKRDFKIGNYTFAERTNYPITVSITPANTLLIEILYDAHRFSDTAVTQMLTHFHTLLTSFTTHAHKKLYQLPLLTSNEQKQIIHDWNQTQTKKNPQPIHHLFEKQAERTPTTTALIHQTETVTYAQLNHHANQLAHHLCQQGVSLETAVGVYLPRTADMVIALLAILKAGGAYVPLDPAYPPERLTYMIDNGRIATLITDTDLAPQLPPNTSHIICLDTILPTLTNQNSSNLATPITSQNLAYILYTSGSTGQPKGVAITHHSVTTLVQWAVNTFPADTLQGVLAATSINFDLSVFELFVPLSMGGAVILADNAFQLPHLPAADQVTLINTVPSAMTGLLQMSHIPTNVQTINLAGEALKTNLVQAIHQQNNCQTIINLYGPSEDTTYSTYAIIDPSHANPPTIGHPISNTQTYILDEYLRPVPVGIPGQLYLGGDGLARGYYGRSHLTAQKFIPNPFSNQDRGTVAGEEPATQGGSRLYQTGDLARYRSDGQIEFLGRIDHQVKIRGFRIELGEIEATLIQHPAIQACIVTVQEMANATVEWIQTHRQLIAYYVTHPKQHPTTSDLRDFLQAKLPTYMIPAIFIQLDKIPLTPNGKTDRKALPAPDQNRPQLDHDFAPSYTPIQEELAQIWSHILNVEPIGIHDSFFELGGHSFLATRVVARIRDVFQVELPLSVLFEQPTLAQIADFIENNGRSAPANIPPLRPMPADAIPPLSFAQERLWFLDQLEGGTATYNIPTAIEITGPLHIDALQQSLTHILKRHTILRTTYTKTDGYPIPTVHPATECPLPIMDLRPHPSATTIQKEIDQTSRTPFTLHKDIPLRAKLLRLQDDVHILLIIMHHIVSDGWSMGLFFSELRTLYNAFAQGQPAPLPELTIQYSDFAHWQRNWLQGDVLESQLDYWRNQLATAPAHLNLPTDYARPAIQTFRGTAVPVAIPQDLTQQLKQLSQQEDCTLFMLLLASFQLLLHRYTGQEDIVVGTPIANRNYSETESLIGFFANTLALRTHFSHNPTFRQLLHEVRQTSLDAYMRQDVPFEKLIDELNIERSLSHTPLFQAMLTLQNMSDGHFSLHDLSLKFLFTDTGTVKFDMELELEETPRQIVGSFSYNTDLFAPDTIQRLWQHFHTLLTHIVANPDKPIAELAILSANEQTELLTTWNDTHTPYPKQVSFAPLFEAQVDRTPHEVAIVNNGRSLTYAQLNHTANQLAHQLCQQGVRPNHIIPILTERNDAYLIAMLAIFKAGAAYLPLDPQHPPQRHLQILQQTHSPLLLVAEAFIDTLTAVLPQLPHHPHILPLNTQTLSSQPNHNPPVSATPQDLAYVIFTSGSTGTPKGAMVEHQGMINHLYAKINDLHLTTADRVIQNASQCFDISVWQLLAALLVGGQVHILPDTIAHNPVALTQYTQQQAISILEIVPSLLRVKLEHLHDLQTNIPTFTALKWLIVTGEALPPELAQQWLDLYPHIPMLNAYGPTECSDDVTHHPIATPPPDNLTHMPIGKAIANTQLYILDKQLQPVPIGVVGQLYVAGDGVGRGYLHKPRQTAQIFLPNPFGQNGSRLYQTGDQARYLHDGTIQFIGRIDYQVKVRGFRIELGEIENALRQHPAVRNAVVQDWVDQSNSKYLAGYLVPHDPAKVDIETIRTDLQETLPPYMIPSLFIQLEALPLTANGKINRKALPDPKQEGFITTNAYVPPANKVEEQLAAIWSELLAVEAVGVQSNFFDLGGHSILAVRLMARIHKQFGQELPLTTLFQNGTIQQLAQLLKQPTRTTKHSPLVAIEPNGTHPPFFCVHPAGGNVLGYVNLARHLQPHIPFYGLQDVTRFTQTDPYITLEAMAAWYLREIRAIQPEGPYYLGGWSFGGHVAYEMAQQLRAEGETTAVLAILDTPVTTITSKLAEANDTLLLAITISELTDMHIPHLVQELQKRNPTEQLHYALMCVKKESEAYTNLDIEWVKQDLNIFRARVQALHDYQPQPYNGHITLYRAIDVNPAETAAYYPPELTATYQDAALGWNKLCTRSVTVHFTPGKHHTIILEPHVQILARQLKESLKDRFGQIIQRTVPS